MATPSRTPAMSTPKTTITPTSVRKVPVASPRSVTAGKGISYKSPATAMKTPASAHSHTHNTSTSSQPSGTPLQGHGFVDGGVNLDSPAAALMGFTNSHGLTPVPHGLTPVPSFDGLGLAPIPTKQLTAGEVRNIEAERLQRLEEIVSYLKTKVAGRGITREGVERVAKLVGFLTYWDDDILTVAENRVDLEIVWDRYQKDTVRDVVLKIDAIVQEQASEILRKDLSQSPEGDSLDPWNHLDSFASNLDRLRELDKPSKDFNCFDAVEGLYAAYRSIWDEEKKRLTWKSNLRHLSRGSAGRPTMNRRRKVGMAIEYWVEKHDIQEESVYDQAPGEEAFDEDVNNGVSTWTAQISCEMGLPSLKISRDWLSTDILGSEVPEPNADDLQEQPLNPIWREPKMNGASAESKDDPEAMKLDGLDATIPKEPNARFTFTLEPMLHLPTNAVAAFEARGLVIALDNAKVTTYQQVLESRTPSTTIPLAEHNHKQRERWIRTIKTYDIRGAEKFSQHSYELHSPEALWCYPTKTVAFSHPRQLAELLPTLRQYALLWSILHKLATNQVSIKSPKETSEEAVYKPGTKIKSTKPQKRSNVDIHRKKLADLLEPVGPDHDKVVFVDVKLTLTGGAQQALKPKLDVTVPLHRRNATNSRFAYVSFEIELNAKVVVLVLRGLPGMDTEQGMQKVAHVIALSEDIGALAEWMLEKAQLGN